MFSFTIFGHSYLLLVLNVFFCISNGTGDSVIPLDDSSYWRGYYGKLPADALPGGTESSGKRTYIGQTMYQHHMIVGEIRPEHKQLYYEIGGPQTTSNNIKILCTNHPEMYQWVRTNIADIKSLKRNTLVPGGFEDFPLYIGRVNDESDVVVGKIHTRGEGPTGLWIAHEGLNVVYKEAFEVLTYNPNVTKYDKCKT